MQEPRIRVRFAPSPTGRLHIGGARTALFNFLFARHFQGGYVLRIDDTDEARSRPEYETAIFEGLNWLGITSDEGVQEGGPFLPYRQSERLKSHRDALERLLASGQAFYCDHPAREKGDQAGPHWCEFRDSRDERRGVIRFKSRGDQTVIFHDLVRGDVSFNTEEIGDFSLARSLESPLYNFASTIDDAEMKISHILRGEEHIANTPRQILVQQALDLPAIQFAHFPLILGADRKKLSKRFAASSVEEFRDQGYLPEALINFLVLLGWHPEGDREIFSLEELVRDFSLERVNPAGAVFDIAKLDWMNSEYIRKLSHDELLRRIEPYLKFAGIDTALVSSEQLAEIIRLEQPRLTKLAEIGERVGFYFQAPIVDPALLSWKSMTAEDIQGSLLESQKIIASMASPFPSASEFEALLLPRATEMGDRGKLLWPLRVALSGKKASPGPFEIASVLGRDEVLVRIARAITSVAP